MKYSILDYFSIPLLLCMLMGLTSCQGLVYEENTDTVEMTLDSPAIVASSASKAAISGSDFPNNHTPYQIGLWLMDNSRPQGPQVPQVPGFGNLKSVYTVYDGQRSWEFYPFGPEKAATKSIDVRRSKALNIYAYHPWVSNDDGSDIDIEAIPFVSGESDWMVASQSFNSTQTGSPFVAELNFQHIMTCIEVRITCKYSGAVTLTSMTLTDNSGTRLISGGSFNCITKEIDGQASNSITIRPNRSLDTGWTSNYIIMPPVSGLDLDNNELVLSFVFNNTSAQTAFPLPSKMKIDGVDKQITELAAGYKYVFSLSLDNTTDFAPVGVEKLWTTVEVNLPI